MIAVGWQVNQCCSNPATAANQQMEQFRHIARAPVGTVRNWTVDGQTTSLVAEDDKYLTWNITLPRSPWFYFPTDSPSPPGRAKLHTKKLTDHPKIGYIGIGEEV